MIFEDLLWVIVLAVVARVVSHLLDSVKIKAVGRTSPQPRGGVPAQGVQMVRDPVCGTFVIPNKGLMLSDGSRQVFFCSPACRDSYRARTA
jgi:YHS domain-containing protein